jgi:hypothetical protein
MISFFFPNDLLSYVVKLSPGYPDLPTEQLREVTGILRPPKKYNPET